MFTFTAGLKAQYFINLKILRATAVDGAAKGVGKQAG